MLESASSSIHIENKINIQETIKTPIFTNGVKMRIGCMRGYPKCILLVGVRCSDLISVRARLFVPLSPIQDCLFCRQNKKNFEWVISREMYNVENDCLCVYE